ncbi:MAG: hypothetical protein GY717_07425, partial [Rhodobacteraceae bacterium]|nr:hypothetical protein [Paracoccaceae bacterium]
LVPAQARFVQVIETTPNRFHLSELEVFEAGVTPDNAGGATFGGLSTSSNDIAGGVPYNIGNVYPTIGTTSSLNHGNVNNQTNNGLESGGGVWSTNVGGQLSQFTLDLGDNFGIDRVRAWPRADGCCTDRWDALTINLYADDGAGNPGTLVSSVNINDPGGNIPHDVTIDRVAGANSDTGTVSIQVTGVNDQPVAADDGNSITELVDDTVTTNAVAGDLFGNDTDVDDPSGNFGVAQVSNTASGVDTSGTIAGDFGTLTYTPNSAGNSGSYTYTLNDANAAVQALLPGQTLADTFTYTVSDNHSDGTGSNNPLTGTADLVITINGANDSPVATDNTADTIEDTTLTDSGNVITDDDGNGADSDVDGPTLTVISAADGSIETDPNVDVTGIYGSLNWDTDGSYTYTLDNAAAHVQSLAQDETATDNFTYALTDSAMSPVIGRFIRVQNNGTANRRMDIGEIEAFAPGVTPAVDHAGGSGVLNPTIDLATIANGASVHSQTTNQPHGNNTTQIIDGTENTGGMWSTSGVGNFVVIDLGASKDIETIRVHQRNDGCCQDRLRDFTVSLLSDDGAGNPGAVVRSAVYSSQPPNNSFGEVTFAPLDVSATDTAALAVTVTGINDAPVAGADQASTDEDTPLNVSPGQDTLDILAGATSIVANDSDVDNGDSFTITGINGTASLAGTSNFGAPVVVNADGSFTYDPTQAGALQALTEGTVVTDSFTYTIEDTQGASGTGTVNILVTGVGGVELDMNLLPASVIRLELNSDPTKLDIFADNVDGTTWIQTTDLFNATLAPDVEVTGLTADSDRLIVDNSSGVINFSALGGVTDPVEIAYDGLGGTNVLEITGDGGPIELEQYDAATSTITFDVATAVAGDEEVISFANVANITDDKPVSGLFEILGTPDPDTFTIGAGALGTMIDGTITPIDFANKTDARIRSLAGDDTFVILDGASFPGSIDGGPDSDTLDYTDWASGVVVDLSDTSLGAGMQGAATGITGGLVAGDGVTDLGSSVENAFGSDHNDELTGDEDGNLLRDGAGNDILSGGPGDDTYQLQPGGGSADYLMDATDSTGDWVDFSQAGIATGAPGVTIDMDLVGWDADGVVDVNDPAGSIDQNIPQDVYQGNLVSLLGVGLAQEPPADSPFENFRGTDGQDNVDIDPLPVVRYVEGLDGDDGLTFDGGTSEVVDTGSSLTALGIGSVVYDSAETVEPFNASARIVDNDDSGWSLTGTMGRSRSEGYLGDERSAGTGTGNNVGRWSFDGLTPGWHRVAVTWIPGPNRATNAAYRVLDGSVPATATTDDGTTAAGIEPINQRGGPSDFGAAGAAWQHLAAAGAPTEQLYFQVTGHSLVVELPDTGDAFVMADAVRVERLNVTEAEIRVTAQPLPHDLESGVGFDDFGTVAAGETVVHTYAVENAGLSDLTVAVQDVPAGYTAVLGTNTVAPGDSTTLT